MRRFCVLVVALSFVGAEVLAQSAIIYPSKGQSPEQQAKDQGECNAWAQQSTGIDPVAVAQQGASAPAPTGPQGERVRGAARGALAGAAVGAIAGDTGQGAAIGAVVGTMGGGMRQRRKSQDQAAAQQASQQQQQEAISTYTRAVNACMQGRGYTVN